MSMLQRKKLLIASILFVFEVGSLTPFFLHSVFAAASTGYLRLDRMAASTATGGDVCINPTTNETTVQQVAITFAGNGTQGSTSFGVNSTAANWTWDTTASNLPTGASAFPGTATTSTVSTNTVTFIVTANQTLNTGTLYCLHFTGTNTLSTPTSANSNLTGTITLKNGSGTTLTNEVVNYAAADISNDQIAVTATVPSTFSFSLSGNSFALGTLTTTGATSATAITATVSTNANNGWIAWVKSLNAGLSSPSTGDSVLSAAFTTGSGNIVDMASTNGYVLDAQPSTGLIAGNIATEYLGNGSSSGGNLATSFKQIASKNSPQSGNQFTLAIRSRATVTNKAAADYADTVTITAAGQF